MSVPDPTQEPSRWLEVGRSLHADCRVFTVEKRTLRHPRDSATHDFFVVCPARWAVALAMTPEGEWVMVQQYRFGTAKLMWEFPSGCCEPGEDPVAAAARELREESGFAGRDPVVLGTVEPNPAIQDNTCTFVFFADAKRVATPQWDEHEEIRVATMPEAEVRAATRDGRMPHALMHAGLHLYDTWRAEG